MPFGTYRLALRLTGLPNCSPGKRSATGDACDIEALRFQHPYFAVHVAGAAQRSVNVLEAEMFIADRLRQEGGGFQIAALKPLFAGVVQRQQRQLLRQPRRGRWS